MKKPSIIYEGETPDRQDYFQDHYVNLAGDTSNIKDYSSFKESLIQAYSKDASLSNLIANFTEQDFIAFYKSSTVQGIINSNLSPDEKKDMFGRRWDTYSTIAGIQDVKEKKIEIQAMKDIQTAQFKTVEPSRIRVVGEHKSPKGRIIPTHFIILWNQEEINYLRKLKRQGFQRDALINRANSQYSYHSPSSISAKYDRTFKRQRKREKRKR